VRAFINQRDASEKTPIENNDHFVGQIHTFCGRLHRRTRPLRAAAGHAAEIQGRQAARDP